MTSTVTKNDRELLASIGEHKALTVKQLSILSQRSLQVVRRRMRTLTEEELIITKMHGYGRGRGRPEDLIFLTEKASALLADQGVPSGYAADKVEDSLSLGHLLLVNWFRIHLLQIQRSLPQIIVHYLNPDSPARDNTSLSKPDSASRGPDKTTEFIPDGIFSITSKGIEKKTLLFFLEVDMGTETLASMDRNHKDIRQKILRYQALFRSGAYKRYEEVFDSKLNGFRLLFLANSAARLLGLCRLVQEMQPSDFIWLVDQERMFSHGLSAKIWARGGRNEDPPQSILGHHLACEIPVKDIDSED
ncbi:MAG: replication-relaxation family protein [Thermodesulfobacteriota bacterium]